MVSPQFSAFGAGFGRKSEPVGNKDCRHGQAEWPDRPPPRTGILFARNVIGTSGRNLRPASRESAMPTNVVAFTSRRENRKRHAARRQANARNNVIELAAWIGKAMPRRTPHGVFFATHAVVTPAEIA